MRVVGHYDSGVKNVSLPVVMQAMLKNDAAAIRPKPLAIQLPKCHKDRPAGLLVMWQTAVIVVVSDQ
jgi:hypothetical protein